MEKEYTEDEEEEQEEDEEEEQENWKKGKIAPMNPVHLLKGFALSLMISGYIIGPLLIFGGIGYWIYKYFKTPKIVLFAFIIFAFGVSNFLIFVRAKKDAEKMIKQTENPDKENK